MRPPAQTFPVLSFLGVIVQLGGALMLIALFLTMRRFVLRRAYFAAWATAWVALSAAILALVVRYILVPGIVGTTLEEGSPATRLLYFVYQFSKAYGFVYFVRGTMTYVAGTVAGFAATKRLWIGGAVFALVSTIVSTHGLNEMVIWQSAIAVPALTYCASSLFRLPRSRRTAGSTATGVCFSLLAALWLAYAVGFSMSILDVRGPVADVVRMLIGLNSYFDLSLNMLLGYSMILVLMEDAKREMNDAQAELRVTHDRLRRAALYDPLTDSLNRRAFAEGVGLDMVRAMFGTVVMADVDNLKLANDRCGHAIGDQLIRRCADILRNELRASDKLYRSGGDEFLLVLPSARATDVMDRLRAAIEAAPPLPGGPHGKSLPLQVSLGAADYAGSEDLAQAIERADQAMYEVKGRRKSDPNYILIDEPTPPASMSVVR